MELLLSPESLKKQRIYLSKDVSDVIETDRVNFSADPANPIRKATFINRIVTGMFETRYGADEDFPVFPAGLRQYIKEKKEKAVLTVPEKDIRTLRKKYTDRLRAKINASSDPGFEEFLKGYFRNFENDFSRIYAEKIADSYAKEIAEEAGTYYSTTIDTKINFSLNQRSYDWIKVFDDPDSEEYRLFAGRGRKNSNPRTIYLSYLLKKYSELPDGFREQVFQYDLRKEILTAVGNGKDSDILKISLAGSSEKVSVCVYGICEDKKAGCSYLVGYPAEVGKKKKRALEPHSWRLGKIVDARAINHTEGQLTEREKEETKLRLEKNGAARVSDKIDVKRDDIIVVLSKQGKKTFSSIRYQRPLPKKVNGDHYVFNGEQQGDVYRYFLRFGKDAYILQPEKLRNSFRKRYIDAVRRYEDEGN